MDYKLYGNSDALLTAETSSSSSKESWHLPSDCSMDYGEENFGWNSIKIEKEGKNGRKRKASFGSNAEAPVEQQRRLGRTQQPTLLHRQQLHDNIKDPLSYEDKPDMIKKALVPKGPARMPQWQVEEYGDINQDIDSTLALGSELTNSQYVSEVLSINVFKQEAPSPTMTEQMTQLQQQIVHQRQSPTSSQQQHQQQTNIGNHVTNSLEENNQNMFNNTITQLLNQTAFANLHTVIEIYNFELQPLSFAGANGADTNPSSTQYAGNNLSPSSSTQDNYAVSSTNYNLQEDCRFQYVLAAATSIATKQTEDTLTYLNQGQSYEIKLKKLGDLSMYKGKMLKSVVRICFHERRLQYMEKEQMSSWQKARPGDRILEVDVPLSYGAFEIVQPPNALNVIHFVWDPTKEVGVYIKVNCISTEFTPKKHGGEKGVPFRIQVETYQNGESIYSGKRLHAAACQIKVFKLKGADRKHKQDREKIMKRPISEQEKYQPSYECTVLNDISNDAVLCFSPEPTNSGQIADTNGSDPQNGHSSPNGTNQLVSPQNSLSPKRINCEKKDDLGSQDAFEGFSNDQLTRYATPEETSTWLTVNRFEKYLETFACFAGADMLRMSREDLIQICGHADGIRLHNILHLKSIAPKLKIYVCRDNSTVFNAVFLSSHNTMELLQKLANLVSVNQNQIRDIYMEGPQLIHVQLTDDMLQHIEDETMFVLNIIHQENGGYIFLLKRKIT